MIPYRWPVLTAMPQGLAKKLEIIQAVRGLGADNEPVRRRRAEIAAMRCALQEITLAVHELQRACDPRQRSYVLKYSPTEPRVPAGGPQGGQWTSDDDVVLAQNKVTPRGFTVQQVPGQDALDPQGLNKPISADEQQKIAGALTRIFNGDASTLQPHRYANVPHDITGAVLPESAAGYTAYDVRGLAAGRGEGRLLVENSTGSIYYTNNHYLSFYPVQLHERGE